MEKFVIDTNFFFNIEAGFDFGKNTDEVMTNFIYYAEKLINKAEFYMPPAVIKEFLSFFNDQSQKIIKKTLSYIKIKSPEKEKINFNSNVFYLIINDIRQRNLQGLNLGEELIKKTATFFLQEKEQKKTKKDFEQAIGPLIKNFRERYRRITREGFLDSTADLDLIVLAKEINGFLVSSDEGVINWARRFGIYEIEPKVFRYRLESLLHRE